MKFINKHIDYKLKSCGFVLLLFFGSLSFSVNAQTLEELKTTAAEQNLELKAQYKAFEAQLEEVTQSKSWQDPNLSFGYFISPIETRVGPQIARFSLTQMLPWFGTYKAKGNIATYKAEAEFEKFQDQKLKLYLEVAEVYFKLVGLRQTEALETEHLKILKDLKSIVNSNYENDQAMLVDILRVDLEIDEQTNRLKVLNDRDSIWVTQLNRLLNRDLKTPIIISQPEQILQQNQLAKSDSTASNHPRLQALRNLQESNQARSVLAKKQALPQFGIGLDYAIIQDKNVQNRDAGQDAIMPMLSVSLPIFGKKNKSRKKQVELQGDALQLQLQDEQQQLETELQVAKFKQEELLSLLELYAKQLERLDDILRLSETALANATMDIEEVLRLQAERLLYEKQKAKTQAELQTNNETIRYLTLNSEL